MSRSKEANEFYNSLVEFIENARKKTFITDDDIIQSIEDLYYDYFGHDI